MRLNQTFSSNENKSKRKDKSKVCLNRNEVKKRFKNLINKQNATMNRQILKNSIEHIPEIHTNKNYLNLNSDFRSSQEERSISGDRIKLNFEDSDISGSRKISEDRRAE
mmetsp:Transcript_15924/g.13905  ORF Transcript_15924/g.13905 Transcript_15924/m.13905 type:complete len:109 (+) Transcript_15924:264-590(+)